MRTNLIPLLVFSFITIFSFIVSVKVLLIFLETGELWAMTTSILSFIGFIVLSWMIYEVYKDYKGEGR